jgi:hypothetical protein
MPTLEVSSGGGVLPPHPNIVGKAMMITAASAHFVEVVIVSLLVFEARAGHARDIVSPRSYTRSTFQVTFASEDRRTFALDASLPPTA